MEKKKVSLKLSIILLIVGIVITIAGVGLVLYGLSLQDSSNVLITMLGGAGGCVGGSLVGVGLAPYITKLEAKLKKESIDYAGEDIKSVTSQTADIYTPAIKKVSKAVGSGFVGNQGEEQNGFCPYCGEDLKSDFEFCPKCGKKISKE